MPSPPGPGARREAGIGRVLALYKPYGVVSQFTSDGSPHRTLKDLGLPAEVWPIGRLDADSEGLLLLASGRALSPELLEPARAHPREYWVQVENVPDEGALTQLACGVVVQGRKTLPCRAWRIDDPGLPPRDPPIRERRAIPTAWIALELVEGKNRQVRHMTAAVGHPTLRLYRARVGGFVLSGIEPGAFRELSPDEIEAVRARSTGAPSAASGAHP